MNINFEQNQKSNILFLNFPLKGLKTEKLNLENFLPQLLNKNKSGLGDSANQKLERNMWLLKNCCSFSLQNLTTTSVLSSPMFSIIAFENKLSALSVYCRLSLYVAGLPPKALRGKQNLMQ